MPDKIYLDSLQISNNLYHVVKLINLIKWNIRLDICIFNIDFDKIV